MRAKCDMHLKTHAKRTQTIGWVKEGWRSFVRLSATSQQRWSGNCLIANVFRAAGSAKLRVLQSMNLICVLFSRVSIGPGHIGAKRTRGAGPAEACAGVRKGLCVAGYG